VTPSQANAIIPQMPQLVKYGAALCNSARGGRELPTLAHYAILGLASRLAGSSCTSADRTFPENEE